MIAERLDAHVGMVSRWRKRWSCTELAAQAVAEGLVLSASTVRRRPAADAITPWQRCS